MLLRLYGACESPQVLVKRKILIHIMSEVEPKICISNKFSCDAAAALSSKGLED